MHGRGLNYAPSTDRRSRALEHHRAINLTTICTSKRNTLFTWYFAELFERLSLPMSIDGATWNKTARSLPIPFPNLAPRSTIKKCNAAHASINVEHRKRARPGGIPKPNPYVSTRYACHRRRRKKTPPNIDGPSPIANLVVNNLLLKVAARMIAHRAHLRSLGAHMQMPAVKALPHLHTLVRKDLAGLNTLGNRRWAW